ncbi:hypothetical protein CkaCkLH20_03779 [Colletotrichum karsti]|uniref:Uncharacterized protein n=1 Tax=Colletotrichum karsti TaxID=1095194 RepID=A0A9P6LK00_9PEZI|nr:uncharacterized protein CkaCkLH20_03779 [Colletotrichum karsti]KAF9878879.1 hypothetical protein CkaCkLH20_03779 [Colletotrichum karsti]
MIIASFPKQSIVVMPKVLGRCGLRCTQSLVPRLSTPDLKFNIRPSKGQYIYLSHHAARFHSSKAPPDNYWTARTLAEMPANSLSYHWGKRDFRFIIHSMIKRRYHRWGYVVYRGAYGDDELWNRYLAQLKQNVQEELERYGRAELLGPYLDWTVVEDRRNLDGASKDHVRRRFRRWVKKHEAETATHPFTVDLPRFRYCLYVDQKCLDTLERFQQSESDPILGPYLRPSMVFILIDRLWTPKRRRGDEGMDEGGYPPIEGCEREYVGWAYFTAIGVVGSYEEFIEVEMGSRLDYYVRPPGIGPYCRETMPL